MDESPYAKADLLWCCILLCSCLGIGYFAKKHQFVYLPESALAIMLGMAFGAVTVLTPGLDHLRFSPQVFFYGLLPPIVYSAGYNLKQKDFFRNFTSISLFAVAGTLMSAFVWGLGTYFLYEAGAITHLSSKMPLLESLMYGALVSATDPIATLSVFADVQVPRLLYNLVFGESVLNDAVAIVLFHTLELFADKPFTLSTIGVALAWFAVISTASILVGFVVSLICALGLKLVDDSDEFSKFELGFVLLSAYASYLIAEWLGLSGIMSLFFCGIGTAHYGYGNMSLASQVSARHTFDALAFLAEMFVFLYLGMQVVGVRHTWDAGLMLSALPLCLISRAINIFPLANLANVGRKQRITGRMMVMMWACGLRGAIAYALSINIPTHNPAIETTTLFIAVSTTLICGPSTRPLLVALRLTADYDAGPPSSRALPQGQQRTFFNRWLHKVESRYIRPFVGGETADMEDCPLLEEPDDLSRAVGPDELARIVKVDRFPSSVEPASFSRPPKPDDVPRPADRHDFSERGSREPSPVFLGEPSRRHLGCIAQEPSTGLLAASRMNNPGLDTGSELLKVPPLREGGGGKLAMRLELMTLPVFEESSSTQTTPIESAPYEPHRTGIGTGRDTTLGML